MAYNRGEPAAGSTAPLWTVALAFVRLLPVDPLLSSYALGLLCLAGSGWLAVLLWQQLNGGRLGGAAAVAAGLVVLDWHLAWSALSGMETPLFVLLSLAIVYATVRRGPAWQVGLLGGLLTATRPEGIALAGLCWAYAVLGLRVQPADRNAGRAQRRPRRPPGSAARSGTRWRLQSGCWRRWRRWSTSRTRCPAPCCRTPSMPSQPTTAPVRWRCWAFLRPAALIIAPRAAGVCGARACGPADPLAARRQRPALLLWPGRLRCWPLCLAAARDLPARPLRNAGAAVPAAAGLVGHLPLPRALKS